MDHRPEHHQALMAQLVAAERDLFQQRGIRIRVDAISHDGRFALCTMCQPKPPFFRRAAEDHRLVDLAHEALMRISMLGLVPLVTVLPKAMGTSFADPERDDPFHLRHALREARLEERLSVEALV